MFGSGKHVSTSSKKASKSELMQTGTYFLWLWKHHSRLPLEILCLLVDDVNRIAYDCLIPFEKKNPDDREKYNETNFNKIHENRFSANPFLQNHLNWNNVHWKNWSFSS